eukprot:11795290-Alexandrium_andersonii.AAC.1
MADVLPLEARRSEQGGAAYRARRRSILECCQKDLHDIGFASLRLVPRRSMTGILEFVEDASLRAAQRAAPEQYAAPRWLQVHQVSPGAAAEHAAATAAAGRRHAVIARSEASYGLQFVLDAPLPLQLDCRPWRCRTCMLARHKPCQFRVTFRDIKRQFPDVSRCVLGCTGGHERPVLFTRLYLLHMVQKFAEVLNARALRRSLLEYYTANCLALAGGIRGL